MIAEDVRVPHARDVRGNLFKAAKPMLLLGWSEPAVVIARAALERSLRGCVRSLGRDVSDGRFVGAGRLSHALKAEKVIGKQLHDDTVNLNNELSKVAHGQPVSLHDAVTLVELTQKRIREIERKVAQHFDA